MIDTERRDHERTQRLRTAAPAWASSPRISFDLVVDPDFEARRLLESLSDEVVAETRLFTEALHRAPVAGTPATRIDRIAALERARAVLAAAQLAEELAFAEQQRAEQQQAGVKSRNQGRGIAEQVGFARRISPVAAARHVGLALALRDRLPEAWKLLQSGEISEDQAKILATRTSHLTETDATLVDAGVSPRMSGWNKKQTEQATDRAAYEIDPQGFVDRRAGAEKNRRVWISPANDSLAKISALLPMAQAVAVYAQLRKAADSICGVGNEKRSRDQVMADLVVTRITGQEQAHLVPVTVNMTITADALLDNGTEPAFLESIGPVPAQLARAIIAGEPPGEGTSPPDNDDDGRCCGCNCDMAPGAADVTAREFKRAKAWLTRILVDPVTGVATNLDTRRREFDGTVRRFLLIRDRTCRHPYCGADIRHADHIQAHSRGGPTSVDNGQGLCERGNYTKEMPGWVTRRGDKPGELIVTTPTGHTYRTLPPHQTGMPGSTTAVRA